MTDDEYLKSVAEELIKRAVDDIDWDRMYEWAADRDINVDDRDVFDKFAGYVRGAQVGVSFE